MPILRSTSSAVVTVLVASLLVVGAGSAPALADPPVAVDDFATGYADDLLVLRASTLTANDDYIDLAVLQVTAVQAIDNGVVSLDGTSVLFTPTAGFTGNAHFSYTVSGGGEQDTGMVTVTLFASYDCGDATAALDAGATLLHDAVWTNCAYGESISAVDPVSTLDAGDIPIGGTHALVTTGNVDDATPPGPVATTGTDLFDDHSTGNGLARDVSTYKLTVDVPDGDNCLAFGWSFGTDETATEQPHLDGFVAELDQSSWSVDQDVSNPAPTLSAPYAFLSFVLDSAGATAASQWPQPAGVAYDRVSEQVTTAVGLSSGWHSIYVSVFDGPKADNSLTADGLVDSGLFLDNLRTFHDDHGCASPLNQLPDAQDDVVNGYAPGPVLVGPLWNDSDPDFDQLSITTPAPAATHGTVSCGTQYCEYTPDSGYLGDDSFTYEVTDGKGGFDTAVVQLSVQQDFVNYMDIAGFDAGAHWIMATLWMASGRPAVGEQVELLVSKDGGELVSTAFANADDQGNVEFTYNPAEAGSYLLYLRVVSNPDLHVDQGFGYDPDPLVLTVEGPTQVLCDGSAPSQATYTLHVARQSGAPVASQSYTVQGGWPQDPGLYFFDGSGTITDGVGTFTMSFPAELCQQEYAVRFTAGSDHSDFLVQLGDAGVSGVSASAVPTTVTWPAVPTIKGLVGSQGIVAAQIHAYLWSGTTSPPTHPSAQPVSPTATHILTLAPARPSRRTFYQWRIPGFGVVSGIVAVNVKPLVSLAAVRKLGKDRITGRTTPARIGTVVRLQRKIGTGAWRTIATTRTKAASTALGVSGGAPYSFAVTAAKGKASYRVLVPADSGRLAIYSVTRRLG